VNSQESVLNRDVLQPFELEAIEVYFDGDRSFYEVFRSSCIEQFATDLTEGDAACAAGDAATLRRVAHSLKSVLRTLGHPQVSAQAKQAEDAAHEGPWDQALAQWQVLRQQLVHSFQLPA
jgi:HPt (histidine-containing phosphotransfer) domain-containing protein